MSEEFKVALTKTFNTASSKIVLKYWKEMYVNTSSVAETPEATYYNLAIKEFILALIQELKNPDDLDNVVINYNNIEE